MYSCCILFTKLCIPQGRCSVKISEKIFATYGWVVIPGFALARVVPRVDASPGIPHGAGSVYGALLGPHC